MNEALVELVLPWPPTVNNYYRHITIKGHSAKTISDHGKAFRNDVIAYCMQRRVKPVSSGGALSFLVLCYPPDSRQRDLDNLGKSLLDAIAHAKVIRNDADIWDLRFRRECVKQPPGRVVVRIGLFVPTLSEEVQQ